jgi:hypothetical protein
MKGLQLKVQLKKKHIMGFFSLDFLKKEKKEFKTPTTSFLMLEAKHDNSKATFAFSSINLSKVVKLISILNFS